MSDPCPTCGAPRPDPESSPFRFDFDRLFALYPRKEGRTVGMRRCQSQVKTKKQYEALERAITNYARICRAHQTDVKYIKLFSTFMSCWKDFLPEGQGPVHLEAPLTATAELEAATRDPWKDWSVR